MPTKLNVRAAVLCDDVRIESNGKAILIGVYAGNVAVPTTPFLVPFYVWINFSPEGLGEIAVNFRISFQGKPVVSGRGGITAERTEDAAFLLPQFLVKGEEGGELLVEMQEEGGAWSAILKKQIAKRADLFSLAPTGASG